MVAHPEACRSVGLCDYLDRFCIRLTTLCLPKAKKLQRLISAWNTASDNLAKFCY